MEVRTNGGFPPRDVVTGGMDGVIAAGAGLRSPLAKPRGWYQTGGCDESAAPRREFVGDVTVMACEPRVDGG